MPIFVSDKANSDFSLTLVHAAHGMSSKFQDWAGDCTNFLPDIVEMALGHKVGNEAELAYRRGSASEKRRRLVEGWARYCDTPEAAKGQVVRIGALL